jgi:reactive intermediate/imine deaminase
MHRSVLIMVAVAVAASSCRPTAPPPQSSGGPPEVQFLTMEGWPYPFSEAVRVGHMLYLSGQIGTDPTTMELVPGGIGVQTRQTMENIRQVLERHGSSLDRVVKCTVMMADMAEWPQMNEVYASYFPEHFPARSALGANGLALEASVEIECWATVG